MSGHSKWNNIKRKKEKTDAQKAKIFTKIGKEMAVAVKAGGPDPRNNARLAALIQKAKANNVPNENIERTIKKATASDGANYEEIVYEGYGPGGVAIIVETTTDNRNRTAGNVRAGFNKYKGNLGSTGCVSYLFEDKGEIVILKDGKIDEDTLMETALEAGASDFASEDVYYQIFTEADDVYAVQEALVAAGYTVESAEATKVPSNYVALSGEEDLKFMNLLLEYLEEDEDVVEVYHNWENCEE